MARSCTTICTALLLLTTAMAEAQRLAFAPPAGEEAVVLRELAQQTRFRFRETSLRDKRMKYVVARSVLFFNHTISSPN